jgi:hypothetical protein
MTYHILLAPDIVLLFHDRDHLAPLVIWIGTILIVMLNSQAIVGSFLRVTLVVVPWPCVEPESFESGLESHALKITRPALIMI